VEGNKSNLPYLLTIMVVLGIFAYYLVSDGEKATDGTATKTKSYSREIKLTEDMVKGLTSVIQFKGFYCPKVKLAYQRDTDAYGRNSKVWCGPEDSDGVFEKGIFRVTFTPKYDETKSPLDLKVIPWTDEMSDW